MPSKTNRAWHAENRMAPKATRDQRIEWHARHAEACACREVPPSIREDVERLRMGTQWLATAVKRTDAEAIGASSRA